jgi:hypothetical protein
MHLIASLTAMLSAELNVDTVLDAPYLGDVDTTHA